MCRFFVFVVIALLLCPVTAHAVTVDYKCPEDLQADQSVSRLPHGWISSTLTSDVPQADHLTVFDGPPGEGVVLAPDNEEASGAVPLWTFPAEKARPLWLRCGYAGRTLYMMRPLPNEVTQCTQTAVHALSCE